MTARLFNTFVLCFWLVAMSWLAAEKILPGLMGGDQPDYESILESADNQAPPDCWKIIWKERTIGFATTQVSTDESGNPRMRSVVRFDELPLESMANELFGMVAVVVKPLLQGGGDLEMAMMIAAEVQFDDRNRFKGFTTTVDLGHLQDFLLIRGQLLGRSTLEVTAQLDQGFGPSELQDEPFLRKQIQLPPNVLVRESLAPRPELKNLWVGQTWTIPVYRPFPPNSPPQILQARVERHDVIYWEGKDVEAFLVVYETDAGGSINIASGPIAREWVRTNGEVLRQELMFSGLNFRFERMPPDHGDPRVDLLDPEAHPRLWDAQVRKLKSE